ncbi:hypothetical protein ACLKA6_016375 [Drosophila palustris]
MQKCCYVLPLKWGMLYLAVVDIILGVIGCLAVYGILLIACLLLIISIWAKSKLAFFYVFTSFIRWAYFIYRIALGFNNAMIVEAVIHLIILIITIYFWFCVRSWYLELKDKEAEN